MTGAIERLERFCVVGLFDAYPDGQHSIIDDVQHILAIAAAARQSGDVKQAPGEAPQSVPKGSPK